MSKGGNVLSALEELKALDAEREKLIDQARAAALNKAHEAIRELGQLGLHYVLIKRTREPAGKSPWLEAGEGDGPSTFDQTLAGS